eukprot:jgi/Mesvir1/9753/Mv12213-RA.1
MDSWLQSQIKKAEELLETVDRTAKQVSTVTGGSSHGAAPPLFAAAAANGQAKPIQARPKPKGVERASERESFAWAAMPVAVEEKRPVISTSMVTKTALTDKSPHKRRTPAAPPPVQSPTAKVSARAQLNFEAVGDESSVVEAKPLSSAMTRSPVTRDDVLPLDVKPATANGDVLYDAAEVEMLQKRCEMLQRQMASLEAKMVAVQAENDAMMRDRDVAQTHVVASLREELSGAERRVEEERQAHATTQQEAHHRESELEMRLAENVAALVAMQRTLQEKSDRLVLMEQRASMLEVECATVNQELAAAEADLRRERQQRGNASLADDSGNAQLVFWKEECDKLKRALREAESAKATSETESQKLRADLQAAKQDVEEAQEQAQQSTAELEKRFRELTELLYQKQTQLESMASDRAAAYLELERKTMQMREVAERERASQMRERSFSDSEDNLRPIESSVVYEGIVKKLSTVGPSVDRAARLLDFSAIRMGKFLWRNPLARLLLIAYLVWVHLFLMLLLHRLQEKVDIAEAETQAAADAGILKPGTLMFHDQQ